MSNELSNFNTLSKDQIMRLTGQEDDSGGGGNLLPRLMLNRAGEDDDGNKLEVGTYTIYDPESDKRVYSKKSNGPVKFRPFIRAYQYMEYNPDEISFEELLDVFWKNHNPTTLNRQGPDVGIQYRSAIFYHDEKQKETAENSKQTLNSSGIFDNPIITQIVPAPIFYEAEEYHQKYFKKHGL